MEYFQLNNENIPPNAWNANCENKISVVNFLLKSKFVNVIKVFTIANKTKY